MSNLNAKNSYCYQKNGIGTYCFTIQNHDGSIASG